MAIQTNLREEDVNEMKKAFEENVLPNNPKALFESFDMSEMKDVLEKGKSDSERIQEISDRLDSIEQLIKSIFDGHVLIDGQFVNSNVIYNT